MAKIEKYPFQYIVEATDNNPNAELEIETPWNIDDETFDEAVDYSIIYFDETDDLSVTEYSYPNGFKMMMITRAGKNIIKTNWKLDPQPNGKFLPRIQ